MNTEAETTDTAGRAPVPVRERIVDFYGDGIPVADTGDELYVAVRPITDFLGLSYSGQRQRIARDEVLALQIRTILMTALDGKHREQVALPLDLLPGFLFGITVARVRPELREKLARYRAECFRVLWRAFSRADDELHPVMDEGAPSDAVLALELATAVQHLARSQVEMEGRLAAVAGRQEALAEYLRGFIQRTNERLGTLEQATSRDATVSEAQAAEIALAVKTVGQRLHARGEREGYARVYSEMYRRYHISTYKALPAARLAEVLMWLHDWYVELDSAGQ